MKKKSSKRKRIKKRSKSTPIHDRSNIKDSSDGYSGPNIDSLAIPVPPDIPPPIPPREKGPRNEAPDQNPYDSDPILDWEAKFKPKFDKDKNPTDQFILIRKISHGTFANVYLVHRTNSPTLYAIKMIARDKRNECIEEFRIHSRLYHPNIVQLYDLFEDKTDSMILMEYVPGQELYHYLHRFGDISIGLKETQIANFLLQLIDMLSYCHDYGVIHRDIKPENLIVLPDDRTLKLLDFGLATNEEHSTKMCGTPEYIAPEILRREEYDYRVDIWSLGILLYEMRFLTVPFIGLRHSQTYQKILRSPLIFPKEIFISISLQDLITKLLVKDPENRASLQRISRHPFIIFYLRRRSV